MTGRSPPRLARVGPEAAALVAALHARCLGEASGDAWGAESIARLLALPGGFALVATEPGPDAAPAGFVLCLAADPAVDIAALGVLPEHRRRGIGAALVAAAARSARTAGAEALLLEVAADNAAAIALYRGCGFAPAARRRDYYRRPGGRCDALVLRRPLTDRPPNSQRDGS